MLILGIKIANKCVMNVSFDIVILEESRFISIIICKEALLFSLKKQNFWPRMLLCPLLLD